MEWLNYIAGVYCDLVFDMIYEDRPKVVVEDEGIGRYEFWGQTGVDVRYVDVLTWEEDEFEIVISKRLADKLNISPEKSHIMDEDFNSFGVDLKYSKNSCFVEYSL